MVRVAGLGCSRLRERWDAWSSVMNSHKEFLKVGVLWGYEGLCGGCRQMIKRVPIKD